MRAIFAAFLLVVGPGLSHARAESKIWTASGTSAWDTPENWSPSGAPTPADEAEINNSGTAVFNGGSTTIGILRVGNTEDSSGGWQVSAGTFNSDSGFIGNALNSQATATISSGTWQNANEVHVGFSGTGTLTIDGGLVTNTYGFMGTNAGSFGSVTMNSGTWQNTNEFYVGESGTGNFALNGGLVSNTFGYVGTALGSQGIATVAGGTWNNSAGLYVGNSGAGTLALIDVGVVTVDSGTGTLILGDQVDSAGTLNFGMGGAAGSLQAAEVAGGAGTADVDFNHTGSVTFDTRLTGSLAVAKNGTGTTVLTGSNSYTGGTTITSGTLAAGNNAAMGTDTVTISGGVFVVQVDVTVENTVILSGGAFDRELTIGQDLANAVDAVSSFAGGTPNTTASLLDGTLSAATTLTTGFSATSAALNDANRLSDVYHFEGTGTDIFVLELSLSSVGPGTYLAWLNGSNQWANAVEGNTGNNATGAQLGFIGSFTLFQTTYGGDLDSYIGAYGVDTATGSTWAVLNHNSDFAILPEPSTAALVAVGSLCWIVGLRRRKH